MGAERRKSRRLPVSLDVVLNHRAQSVICTMRDICLDGAFLDVEPDLLPFGGTLELNFFLPHGTEVSHVSLPATIQRTTGNGAAVSFCDIGQDAYFHLVDLVVGPVPATGRTI